MRYDAVFILRTMDTTYLIENYVTTKPGEPYRLFPFGRIVKGGKVREITPEYAAQFKLPHFKPPVKLGSHDDTTPAGGHIVGLEVRADGLYAVPEWNENGDKSIRDGAYRYHSPEILFDGGLEDPATGSMITAPLVIGDALLHAPHLGEAAKLYSIEAMGEETMEDTIQMPKNLWDKFIAPLFDKAPEIKEVVKEPEDYAVAKQERDEYKSKLAKIEADRERGLRVEKFSADLKETKADPSLAELLADLPDEKADAVMKQFRALSAQIDESKLTGEKGAEGGQTIEDPKAAFNAAVLALVTEKKINYNAAFEQAKESHKDLFVQAFAKS